MEININKFQKMIFNQFEKYHIDLKSKFIIGVSGGPDSMWLLRLMKNLDICVATVNYNKRVDAWKDQKIVEEFCKTNNINYEVLVLDKNHSHGGNFQEIARNQRYDFYKQLYEKNNADYLILAHHKDDTIETFLFQKNSKRNPRSFGISIVNSINGMNIFRPMIEIWYKDEIKEFCDFIKLEYAIDSTNNEPVYTRNKIRLELKNKKKIEKDEIFNSMICLNKKSKEKFLVVDSEYEQFEKNNFNYKKLNLNHEFINEILFEYIHKNIKNVSLTVNKINLFKKFIKSQKNYKTFRLSKKIEIYKHDNLLKVKEL